MNNNAEYDRKNYVLNLIIADMESSVKKHFYQYSLWY